MLRISPVAVAIRDHLIVHSGSVDDALSKACHDIHLREERIRALERQIKAEERDVSAGYVRRHPTHRARQPKPVRPAINDDWIKTGAEAAASSG